MVRGTHIVVTNSDDALALVTGLDLRRGDDRAWRRNNHGRGQRADVEKSEPAQVNRESVGFPSCGDRAVSSLVSDDPRNVRKLLPKRHLRVLCPI